MSRLSARCDASPIQASGPSPVAARRPRNAPGTLPALSILLAAVLLAGCAVTQPSQIPERMLPCRRPRARTPMASPIT